MTPRHFALGGETTTFCKIPVSTLAISERVHPSKGRKEDCTACKAERSKRKQKSAAPASTTELNDVDLQKMLDDAGDIDLGFETVIIDPDGVETSDPEAVSQPVYGTPVLESVYPLHEAAPRKQTKDGRWLATTEEVAKVFALRSEGHSYNQIEDLMGWPSSHGNRPWRIIKGLTKAAK